MVTHHQWRSGCRSSSAELAGSARVGGAGAETERDRRRHRSSRGSDGGRSYGSDGRRRATVTGCVLKEKRTNQGSEHFKNIKHLKAESGVCVCERECVNVCVCLRACV